MQSRYKPTKSIYSRDIERLLTRQGLCLNDVPVTQRHPDVPRTRADCKRGIRPCPFVACKFNLFLHVTERGGIQFPHGDDLSVLETLNPSCTLDVADAGPIDTYRLGDMFDRVHTQIGYVVEGAMAKLAKYLSDEMSED